MDGQSLSFVGLINPQYLDLSGIKLTVLAKNITTTNFFLPFGDVFNLICITSLDSIHGKEIVNKKLP